MSLLTLAYGLNKQTSGIERAVTSFCHKVLTTHRIPITVVVDDDAEWWRYLPSEVDVQPVPRPSIGVAGRVRLPQVSRYAVVYSVGPPFPKRASRRQVRAYTLHDWGPLRDRSMTSKSRLAWSGAMLRAVVQADVIHVLVPSIATSSPYPLRSRVLSRLVVDPGFAALSLRPLGLDDSLVPAARYVLYVGSTASRKRVDRIVEAAKFLPEDLTVVLAGPGTEAFRGARNVTALGAVTDAQLASLYASCSAAVLISDYEGFGLTPVEAAAVGKRTVVSPGVARIHSDSAIERFLWMTTATDGRALAVDIARAAEAPPPSATRMEAAGPGLIERLLPSLVDASLAGSGP